MTAVEEAKRHVLVVDDEELNREILSDYLSEEYIVETACNGAEALEIIKSDPGRFSALLTDLHMPIMNGLDLLKELKDSGLGKHFPIVVLTSDNDASMEVRCLDLDAIAFIRKPYHPPVVLRHTRNVVDLFIYQQFLESEVTKRVREIEEQGKMLERERTISKQMGFEASHDALTGLLNRQAYLNIMDKEDFGDQPVALLHVDVDHFKELNDKNGHDFGDEVLRLVATELSNGIGSQGRMFRMGGDEFVLIISSFDIDQWDRLCGILETVHKHIAEALPEGISASLSGGIAISNHGVDESLYKTADIALYNTKRQGRAGCTLCDSEGNVLRYWKDGITETRFVSALEQAQTGSWRIEIPEDGSHPVFYCDETSRMLMGMREDVTPEEFFNTWLANVETEDVEIIAKTRDLFLESKKAECLYRWNHPTLGTITLRSGGLSEPYAKGMAFQGYHQMVSGTYNVGKDSITQF